MECFCGRLPGQRGLPTVPNMPSLSRASRTTLLGSELANVEANNRLALSSRRPAEASQRRG